MNNYNLSSIFSFYDQTVSLIFITGFIKTRIKELASFINNVLSIPLDGASIYMPLDAVEKCKVGDKVVAGESILAALR